jgi:hypothetical protein
MNEMYTGTSPHRRFLQLTLLAKPSAADEANRWADPRSLAANEGLELGDSSQGPKWSHHCLHFGRSSKLRVMVNLWLHNIENSTAFAGNFLFLIFK